MRNKLGYLSLLSLLGIIGILTEKRGYLGFWSYLYYIRYFNVIPDELFKANVQKAAVPAFFTGIAASAVTIFLRFIANSREIISVGMGLGFALSIAVFTLILTWYEAKEKSETEI